MTPTLAIALFTILAVLLVAVSVAAGALWWRIRAVPVFRVLQLARDLAERQQALEALIARLDAAGDRPKTPRRGPVVQVQRPAPPHTEPRPTQHRRDDPEESAIGGPTLISVPTLAALARAETQTAQAMQDRFGPIWMLAEQGLDAQEIAHVTGQPIGQVELVLGLRRQLAAVEARR